MKQPLKNGNPAWNGGEIGRLRLALAQDVERVLTHRATVLGCVCLFNDRLVEINAARARRGDWLGFPMDKVNHADAK